MMISLACRHSSSSASLLQTWSQSLVLRQFNINAQERMCSLVNRTKVVVFMRGTERRPDTGCRDSVEVASILDNTRVLWDAVNIVTDTNAELAIREYSGGDRRIPLIFMGGQVLGGVAELREAQLSGQLETIFDNIGAKRRKPRL